jgi:twitching motility two-component system response regulator PilH
MSDKLVLVVEDHRPNARLLALLAQRCGVTAQVVSNGAEALIAMQTQRPDLILLDLMMPIMTGNELLEVMRSDPGMSTIPVVIVTTEEEPEVGTPYGLPYIRKPFDPAEVQQVIEELLKD